MPQLTVVLVPAPGRMVVRLTGHTDRSTAPELAAQLARAAAAGTHALIVDVAAVRFWDCSGLHALVDLSTELGRDDRQLRIVGAGPATRRLIAIAGFAADLELDGPARLLPQSHRRSAPPSAAPGRERPMEIPA